MLAKFGLTRSRVVLLLVLAGLLSARSSTSRLALFDDDHDADAMWNGRPLPRPDSPAEALRFRHQQWADDAGSYRPGALMEARAHVDTMRQDGPIASLQGLAGINNAGWTWVCPGNIGGRVRSLVIDPNNVNTMLAGSVGGGIFKTTSGGGSWAPVDDFMVNLAVSTLVMQPGTPATIYAGTGEGFYNGDGLQGAGVFKSTDGGTTWNQLASTASAAWYYVNRLAMSPSTGAVLLAATRTGLYRSIDGGATWSNRLATEVTDVNFDPTDATKAVASGYGGNAFFSADGGQTWATATGLPGGSFVRVEVEYARSTPTTVYASADVSGGSLYKSVNGGASYALVFSGSPDYLGSQGWYDNALWVDPTNANTLVVGGIDLWKSTDGGLSFSQISNWQQAPNSAHADNHFVVEQPGFDGAANRTVFFTNDGGVYKTTNVYTVGGGGPPYTSGW